MHSFLGKSFSPYVTIYKSVNLNMKIKSLIFLAGIAGLCACVKGTHTQKAYDFTPLDSIISGWMDKGYYPGGAVCVMKDDSVLFRKDYGGFTDSTQVYLSLIHISEPTRP